MDLLLITAAAGLAGFVDAIVGGGGLILVPALFATYPGAHPATMLGNNKSASVWGSVMASWQYSRKVSLQWRPLLVGSALALVGALLGAWVVTQISPAFMRKALPVVLLGLLGYTLARKDLGREHAPRFAGLRETLAMGTLGLVLGFYDGFFGPGTGSFFVFLLVRWLGYDFLNASAHAKLLNTASNAAALYLFAWQGHVWWHLALPLALANVLGSLVGSRMALRHGAGFVRWMFIAVVTALILKTSYDAFWRAAL